MSDKLRRGNYYPVGDAVPADQCKALGLSGRPFPLASIGVWAKGVSAVWTGEKRPPRKGEWYLSGAKIVAYRAPNDLSSPYHIARLVKTETVTITREVKA